MKIKIIHKIKWKEEVVVCRAFSPPITSSESRVFFCGLVNGFFSLRFSLHRFFFCRSTVYACCVYKSVKDTVYKRLWLNVTRHPDKYSETIQAVWKGFRYFYDCLPCTFFFSFHSSMLKLQNKKGVWSFSARRYKSKVHRIAQRFARFTLYISVRRYFRL